MAERQQCPECGAPLQPGAGEGLCTKCLLKAGLEDAAGHGHLHVRCPHCHNPIELVEDTPLRDITCPTCDSKFSLVGDATTTATRQQTTSIGHFELIEQVGMGGFGAVWKARDCQLDRTVAVKVPRRDQISGTDIEQFLREARAAAQLKHPNIVSVHEVGRSNGQVYIVSDYVNGVTVADWLGTQQPTPREAAELCAKIAEALQHAHDAGVIHRDLKPSNIMLTSDGEPHIMDFGLAKREAAEITITVDGKVLGTPAYMSPEQARGQGHDADARSDVYSLGVVLFEMLTGEKPFRGTSRMLLHQVIHDDAPQPRRLNGAVPRDVETICLKCLEKESNVRYQSARELQKELRRFLRGEPIRARPITSVERTLRWCARNRLVAGLAATLLASLLMGLIGVSMQWLRAEGHAAREAASKHELHGHLYTAHMNLAAEAWQANNVTRVLKLLKRHQPSEGGDDPRGFEWFYLWNLAQRGLTCPTFKLQQGSRSVAISGDGTTLAAGTAVLNEANGELVGQVRVWDIKAQKELRIWSGQAGEIVSVAFLPGRDVIVCATYDDTIELWNWTTGEELATFQCSNLEGVAVSPNGERLAAATASGMKTWDADSYQELSGFGTAADKPTCLAFSPDSATLAVGSRDGTITLWDAHTQSVRGILKEHARVITDVAFSPDGNTLASSSDDFLVKVWDVAKQQEIISLTGHTRKTRSIAFSPDGETLASTGNDNTIKLWNVTNWEERDTLKGHGNRVYSLAFTPDGRTLASASRDKTVKLWNLDRQQLGAIERKNLGMTRSLAFSPDNKSLLVAGEGVSSWNVAADVVGEIIGPDTARWFFALSPDGSTLATSRVVLDQGQFTSQFALWKAATGTKLAQLDESPVYGDALAFSPEGKLLATANENEIKIWNVPSGEFRFALGTPTDSAFVLAFSPDAKTLVSGGADSTVKLWDLDTRKVQKTFQGHADHVYGVAFSPDGGLLASAGSDLMVKLWDVQSGYERATLEGHSGSVVVVVFSPDGKRLVSGSHDQTIKIWDLRTTEELATLHGHTDRVTSLAFSPDGNTLASGGLDRRVILWQAASRQDVRAAGW